MNMNNVTFRAFLTFIAVVGSVIIGLGVNSLFPYPENIMVGVVIGTLWGFCIVYLCRIVEGR